MISIFDMIALLLTLSALFSWLNRRFVKLPHSVGLLSLGLLASLILVAVEIVLPGDAVTDRVTEGLRQINFSDVVMNGMLAFLLFAGSLNLNLEALRDRAWPVAVLALVGTVISTALIGGAFWGAAQLLGHPVPLRWALVFGALISPTDPVAVLSALKYVSIPASLQIEMEGEALFNDGVGVVLFTLLLAFATHGGVDAPIGFGTVAGELLREAGGGLVLGVVTGYLGYRAMRTIDDFPVEVLITLAVVAGTYAVAQRLGTSGPLAVVAAGLVIADRAPRDAMSDTTQMYVSALWTLVDEVLNAVLFLLIGLEVAVLHFQHGTALLGLAAVPIALVARLMSVSAPLLMMRRSRLSIGNVPFLTWAGVRGGISVALALSLPNSDSKPAILAATYAVVLFSVIVQGTTLGRLARATVPGAGHADPMARHGAPREHAAPAEGR